MGCFGPIFVAHKLVNSSMIQLTALWAHDKPPENLPRFHKLGRRFQHGSQRNDIENHRESCSLSNDQTQTIPD